MIKRKLILPLILSVALLSGCGNKGNEGSTGSGQLWGINTEFATETESTTEATTEATTEMTTEAPSANQAGKFPKPEDEVPPGDNFYISKNMMKYYLDGSWDLMTTGMPIQDPEKTPDILTFDSTNEKMRFTRGKDSEYAEFSFTLDDLFSEIGGTSNLLKLEGTEVSDNFSESCNLLVGMTDHYQIVLANVQGVDMLMLRPIGNGDSLFGAEGLGFDTQINEFWVFCKHNDSEGYVETKMDNVISINQKLLLKDKTFYAFRWLDKGMEVYLEPLDAAETTLNLYGDDVASLCYNYRNNEFSMSAVAYSVENGQDLLHSGRFNPGLVKVTTNANGEIVSILDCEYYIYGYYYSSGREVTGQIDGTGKYPGGLDDDGRGPDERDPAVYGKFDELFLGAWKSTTETGTGVAITQADPQTGGYYLNFTFYGKGGATASAYGDEYGGLCVYNGVPSSGGGEFQAYANSDGNTLSIFITWSDADMVPEFETFTYTK